MKTKLFTLLTFALLTMGAAAQTVPDTLLLKLFTLLTFALLTMGAAAQTVPDTLLFVFKLHGQTRRFEMSFEERNDSVRLTWGIERKLKWLSGTFTMTPDNMENGTSLSFLQPEDQQHIVMPAGETVYLIGRKAYRTLKATGRMAYNLTTYRLLDTGEEMWILDNPALPLVWRMKDNPLEINWTMMVND